MSAVVYNKFGHAVYLRELSSTLFIQLMHAVSKKI